MRVTVCELRNDSAGLREDWDLLVSHVRGVESDLVLLPEMPFAPWLAGMRGHVEARPALWQACVDAHTVWLQRLPDLAPAIVVGSRPVLRGKQRLNEGFVWTASGGLQSAHCKVYLPDEEGFWEATWYDRGPRDFHVVDVNGIKIGFLMCTEMWFNGHCRSYATEGIHLLVTPRSTYLSSLDKWVAGGRTAAVVAGAYGLSSNRGGVDEDGVMWGGAGWVLDPDGAVLAVTDRSAPIQTVEVVPAIADAAKLTYPRYVEG